MRRFSAAERARPRSRTGFCRSRVHHLAQTRGPGRRTAAALIRRTARDRRTDTRNPAAPAPATRRTRRGTSACGKRPVSAAQHRGSSNRADFAHPCGRPRPRWRAGLGAARDKWSAALEQFRRRPLVAVAAGAAGVRRPHGRERGEASSPAGKVRPIRHLIILSSVVNGSPTSAGSHTLASASCRRDRSDPPPGREGAGMPGAPSRVAARPRSLATWSQLARIATAHGFLDVAQRREHNQHAVPGQLQFERLRLRGSAESGANRGPAPATDRVRRRAR